MKVWLSGSHQQALVKGDDYSLLEMEPEKKIIPIDEKKISAISQDWQDVYSLDVESTDDAFAELHRAILCYDATLVASLALDKKVSPDHRKQAAIEAERIFEADFAKSHVQNLYFAQPMPENADFLTAREICFENSLEKLEDLILTIESYTTEIAATRNSWNKINDDVFGSSNNRQLLQTQIIRAGLFLSMATRIDSVKRCEKFIEVAAKTEITNPNFDAVIEQWVNMAKQLSINNHIPAAPFPPLIKVEGNLPLNVSAVQVSAGVMKTKHAFAYA